MNSIFYDDLIALKDEKHQLFTAKLIPNIKIENIIGIKSKNLKNLAKTLYKTRKEDTFLFINNLPHKYFEEYILHIEFLNKIKDIDVLITEIEKLLPHIDNWAVCDSGTYDLIGKNHSKVLPYIKKWLNSKESYTIRYALVLLLSFYLDDFFTQTILEMTLKVKSNDYYVNIALAWFYSYALIKKYEATLPIILNKKLDKWVHNKTISKAIESNRVLIDTKTFLKSLRIK